MKKALGHVSEIGKRILFIGFSIQVILGIIWMCLNFSHLRFFSTNCGILYRGVEAIAGESFRFVYALQIIWAVVAGYYALRRLTEGSRVFCLWGSMVLLTFPMAMQCHLAIAPYSVAGVLFLGEVATAVAVLRDNPASFMRDLIKLGAAWVLSGLILPEYTLLGAVPFVSVVLFKLLRQVKEKRGLWKVIVLTMAFWGLSWGLGQFDIAEPVYDKVNVSFSLFHRTSWPTLWNDAEIWALDENCSIPPEIMREGVYKAEELRYFVKPMVEEKLTEEQQIVYFSEKAAAAWMFHKASIIKQCGWDALCYSFSPIFFPLQMRGEGYDSYAGRNYELMLMHAPRVTGAYMRYSCGWFAAALLIGVILTVIQLCNIKCKLHDTIQVRMQGKACGEMQGKALGALTAVISVGSMITVYTLRGAGMMDYKCTLAVVFLWLGVILCCMRKDAE